MKAFVGVIGGTGLGASLGAIGKGESVRPETPFGRPSSDIQLTEVSGVRVALLSRHGAGHTTHPSQVPYRANIYALKELGVTHVLASTAVGSLREEIAPKSLVLVDQFIDKTFRRAGTFFDDLAAHVEFAEPTCPIVRGLLQRAASGVPYKVHPKGTYVCMEGPQFSTKAESMQHRSWGADLIGMTAMPEAKLAREAELCYALVSLPTDYDCWRPHEPGATKESLLKEIIGNLKEATANAIDLIRRTIPLVASAPACSCQSALEHAIFTDKAMIPPETKKRLPALLEKYVS